MDKYRLKSIRTLFHNYADENNRIDRTDAEETQQRIRNELQRRLQTAITLLETAKTDADAEQIYKQFVEH